MIGKFSSLAEKAIDAVARNQAALGRSIRRLADHDAARPAGDDADALFAWKRERRDLEDRIEADREALAFAEERAEEARAEAAERALTAKHAAEEKRAGADAKLIREADVLAAKLAEKLAEVEASRARTAAVNANRGTRRFIVDAEARMRQRMGQPTPAITETREVWVDEAGDVVAEYTTDREGRQIKNPRAIRREPRTFTIRSEMPAMAIPFKRLAGEIRLIDIEGRQIWPR